LSSALSVEELIKAAREFAGLALKEFEEGVKEGSAVKLRDSAEKAWNGVVQAVNALVLRYEGFTPRSHYERRLALKRLEDSSPRFKDYGLYDRYAARSRLLHGEVFYEGVVDPELLKVELEKAKELVEYIAREAVR